MKVNQHCVCFFFIPDVSISTLPGILRRMLMWDVPLYAVNMSYYYWLIKKRICPLAKQKEGQIQGDASSVLGSKMYSNKPQGSW